MAKLLLLDEDTAQLQTMAEALSAAGHEVLKISELEQARAIYVEEAPDLVILDVRVGAGGGWEWLAAIAPETPTIVVSGLSLEEDIVRGLDAGAADYITRPYRSGELLARIRARLVAPAWVAEPAPIGSVAAEAHANGQFRQATSAPEPLPRALTDRRKQDEEAVFMSEAEEMALLRMNSATETAAKPLPETGGSIGARMRRERQHRQITLVQIENEIKVRLSYLQAMEDDKFTLLPRGPAALHMVRAYARYLGMDEQAVVEEFRSDHYSGPVEFYPDLGGLRRPRPLPRQAIVGVAMSLALILGLGAIMLFDPELFGRVGGQLQLLWNWLLGQFG